MTNSDNGTNGAHDHHYDTHHRGTELVPYGKVIGITTGGVPVFSNGSETFFSREYSMAPYIAHLSSIWTNYAGDPTNPYHQLGIQWMCVEFARRYLVMTRGVWLRGVPTAEDLWHVDPLAVYIQTGTPVNVRRHRNGETVQAPRVGDLIIWGRSSETPFGHVAVVTDVSETWIRVAEQNQGFERWPEEENYSRQLERKSIGAEGFVELVDEDPLLGWIEVDAPVYDFSTGDIPDHYRHILSRGQITRYTIERETTLPWLNPSERCDFFLKRSLVIDGYMGENASAKEVDVPDAYYLMDYDMWCRVRYAAKSLHEIAMEATRHVLSDPGSETLLECYFGLPKELHHQLRRCFETTPPMCGRFDFGYDGKDVVMLEYNCDSSAAMLECGDTQEKMCRHYGVNVGSSTGSFLRSKIVGYFKQIATSEFLCPRHKLIHFMIDDDDEERYTALYAMNAAEEAGFRAKLCVRLTDFRFLDSCTPANSAPKAPATEHRLVVDLEGEEVLLVWKTWSWDTVLRRYAEEKLEEVTAAAAASKKPTLPSILLNEHIRVLEPLWKAVTGSKAILPLMYAIAPNHPNMVPAAFQRTKEIISGPYLSKPVNGRAGQNIQMFDAETNADVLDAAPPTPAQPPLGRSISAPLLDDLANGMFATSVDADNESSTGKFLDSVVVYQKRVFLKRYEKKYFPIFCGWTIGGEFAGVVVREDTSKITKLSSLVVPSRVVRENVPLHPAHRGSGHEET